MAKRETERYLVSLVERELYQANPNPYVWKPLPEAFIGELGCYYPARTSEARALVKEGLIERDSEGYEIDDVPVYGPTDREDGGQTTPDEIEAALRRLRTVSPQRI